MLLAAGMGLAIGAALNVVADRLPRDAQQRAVGTRHVLRVAVLELLCCSLCAYLQRNYGWSSAFVVLTVFCGLLLLISIVDLEHSVVPNIVVGPGMVLALIASVLRPSPGLVSAVVGAALGSGIFLLLALVRRDALGFGDVKLAALIGMMTGFPMVLQALIVGIVFGGLSAAMLLLTRTRNAKQYIPYAPYLAAGCIATLLWGVRIATWYAGFISGKR